MTRKGSLAKAADAVPENSISCFSENVKKFRSCIFEGGGRLSLLKPVAKSGIMNTKSGFLKRQQTDVLK